MRRFTIVSQPNYQDTNRHKEWKDFFHNYKENSFSTRLTDYKNPLGEAVKTLKDRSVESDFFLELTHPNSPNLSTVCIWKHQGRDNRYYVKDLTDLTAFDSTNRNNLLYLPTLRGKNLINFRNISDDENYRYRVIEAQELGFPNSLASTKSDVSGVFFKQVKSDEGLNPVIINLEYDPEITDDRKDEYHAVGWLNPVILTLDLDGNDIEYIENANKNEFLNALSLFLDQSSLILVEPHIDESYDLRISFLIKLNQIIQERQQNKANNKNLSLIEYILFVSQYSQPWKPFLVLDLLGGEFYAYQNLYENQEQEKPLVGWKSPQDAKSNKLWFADYWLKRWVNSQEINIQSKVNVVSPPSLARPYRSSRGLVTFQVNDLSETTLSLTSLLKGHPGYISDPKKNNPYCFLVELFQNPEFKKYSEKFTYDSFWRTENQNNRLLKFDDVDFWNFFSKRHVVPESPILIAIPNQDNRFLEPINSINFGAYNFLWGLFNCFDSERERELIEFYNNFGWWNDWHLTIFNERWDVCLKFLKHGGFVIKKSLLGGKDCLGLKTNRVDWKNPKMRFSCPTENNLL